jgi:hypothetical protein
MSYPLLNFSLHSTRRLLSILWLLLLPLLSWGQVNLPINYQGPWASPSGSGYTASLGSDYATELCGSASGTKGAGFKSQGNFFIVNFTGTPGTLSFCLMGNPSSGSATVGTFDVLESNDGTTYTSIQSIVNKDNSIATYSKSLLASTRYVKFIYTTKSGGNIQLDNVQISAASTSTPTLTATTTPATSPAALTGFAYVAGNGPSAAQGFSLSGSNLTAGTITITGSTNYEVSTDNASFGTTATIANTAGGTLAATPVYVRLKAGLATGSYNNETIAVTGGGTASGANVTASGSVTAASSPSLTTTAAGSLTATTATLNGSISSFGAPTGSSPAYGFVYSLASANATPTLGGTGTTTLTTGTAATAGAFSSAATGLTANTLYAAQAYATNDTGTSYGGVVSFTTLANVSSTTDAAPGQTTAAPGGTVTVDGAAAITDRGVYYSTTSGFVPTTGTKVAATPATGTGSFTSALAGLTPGTTYYVVAYATNAGGTSYGAQVSFATAVPTATLTATPTSLNLGTTAVNTPGASSTYTLSGSGLTAGVTITPPAGVEVSSDGFQTAGNSSATSLTISQAAATAGATISVRLAAGAAATITNQNITNTSAGATTQNVAVSGTVTSSTSTCLSDGFEATTFPPAGWLRSSLSDVTRSTATGDFKNGVAAAIFGTATGTFTTPAVANPSSLTFYLGVTTNTGAKQFQVSVSTTSQTSGFTVVQTFSHNTTGGTVLAGGTYNQYTVDLSAYTGFPNVWIQFAKVNSSTTSPFRFDDVAVTCGQPTALTVATGAISPAGPYCVGQSPAGDVAVSVPFTVTNGPFAAGNVFTAYLSNDNFVNDKTAIGTLSGTTSSTINATLKQAIISGSNYRIRVEGSTAAVLTDNGANLTLISYLDNEVASIAALPGNGQAALSFTTPVNCATDVVVTIKANTTVGTTNKPLAGGTYTPGAGGGSVAFGTGTDLGGGQYVVYNGPATGSITVTGLTNGTRYAFGVFTTSGGPTGTTGYSNGTSRSVVPVVPATLTELVVPQYLSGHASGSSTHPTRLPYVWRATLGSLQPSTTYKYYTAVRLTSEAANSGGAGIPIETQTAGGFVRKTTSGLDASSSTFTTDAAGTYTGWFGLEPTADARFNDQALVYPLVVLNSGDGLNVATQYLATSSTVTVVQLNTSATGATGVRGSSFGTPSNLVLAYDNTAGTGRPLAGTWLEDDGSANSTSYPTFYANSVDAKAGAYGLLTPNANASGIQRLEQRALSDGSLVGCAATDADGTWAGGANTTSPRGGTTALVLTTGDTPFAAPTLTATSSTSVQPGQTLTLTGTGFSASPNAQVTFAPGSTAAAATVNATGTSLTVVVPTGAGSGTIAVANSCGTSSTLATSVPPPAAPGMLLAEDDFDYTGALSANGWTGSGASVTQAGNITASMYPQGLLAAGGTSYQARVVGTSGGSLARLATIPSSATTLYAAALINVTSSATVSGDDYIFSFLTTSGGSSGQGRVTIARPSSALTTKFVFRLQASNATAATPSLAQFDVNTPYIMVLKAENSAATGGSDQFSLYVLPTSADLSREPSTPLLTTSGLNFFSAIGAFQLRLSDSNNPILSLDNFRFATGWGTAVGNPTYTAAGATITAGNYASLTLNNGSTLTPIGAVNVEKQLALTSGTVNTTATNSLTLYPAVTVTPTAASSSSGYVNGPVLRPVPALGSAQSFVFPVGSNGNYRPLTLNVASQTSPATYTATQTEGNAGQSFSAGNGLGTAPLLRVSAQRYYAITTSNVASGFSGTVTLAFGPNDYVNNPADAGLVVAKRDAVATDPADNNKWTNLGHSAGAGAGSGAGGTPVSGSITSAAFTSFSDFTLGATNSDLTTNALAPSVSPLPVQLTSFGATRQAGGVQVAWATASEKNSDYFVVERSLDGRTFASVARVAAHGTTAQAHAYASLDGPAPAALLYYRLRQADLDGTVAYSPVVTVAATDGATAEFALTPNPARERVSFLTAQPTAYTVRNTLGQLVRSGTTAAGTNELLVNELPAGVYFFELHGAAGRVVRKFVKE